MGQGAFEFIVLQLKQEAIHGFNLTRIYELPLAEASG